MAYTITPLNGIDFSRVYPVGEVPSFGPYGAEVFGSDGKIYVFAKAGGAIPASTAVCTVNPTTFAATATGGAYLSPATAMVTGDSAWFAKASV